MAEERCQDAQVGTTSPDVVAPSSSSSYHHHLRQRQRKVAAVVGAFIVVAAVVGLGVGLSARGGAAFSTLDDGPYEPLPVSRLSAYGTSMLDGYDFCDDYVADLEQAARAGVNAYIDRTARQYYHDDSSFVVGLPRGGGGGWGGNGDAVMESTATMTADEGSTTTTTTSAKGGGGGEDSFGTNNQVDGVDEADAVKSDGTYVYTAYGDTLVVWEADSGKEVTRTVIPTDDEEGVRLCDKDRNHVDKIKITEATTPCYLHDSWQRMKIVSLLLHKDRITAIVQAPQYYLNAAGDGASKMASSSISSSSISSSSSSSSSVLYGQKATRVFVYDTSTMESGSGDPLPLVKRKDLHGYYQSARSVEEHAHIVTSSGVNMWDSVYHDLEPYDYMPGGKHDTNRRLDSPYYNPPSFDKEKLSENQYRNAARDKAEASIPALVQKLTLETLGSSSPDVDRCRTMVRLAFYAKQYGDDDTSAANTTTTTTRTSVVAPFTTSNVLRDFAQVTSFNILDNGNATVTSMNTTAFTAKSRRFSATSSGIFVPMNSYSKSVYSSRDKLILAGEAYEEDKDGNWEEKTLFFSFGLEQATSTPESVGQVPGSLLNQFSMDHVVGDDDGKDYLRVATTSWARWGVDENDVWTQTEESSSQVTVLTLPDVVDGDDGSSSKMEIVGQATDLGKGERIYAVRFLDDKAFVVTFRQIDPFYTLDMSDPTNPVVVGELKIPGFSNYLHPIGNGNTVLAVGQDADETTGRTMGLQIALYDVTDMANPTQVKKFSENSSNGYSSSDAQYDHQAFRYLPDTEVLILPVRRYSSTYEENFDGFIVYDIVPNDPTTKIRKKFEISHRSAVSRDYCWSYKSLTARSLVFDGDVMTMKGHTVLSHALGDENGRRWMLNLDSDRGNNKSEDEGCYGWGY